MLLKEVKKGEYFTKKEIEYPTERQVWVKGDYDKSTKKYECHRFDDVNTFTYVNGTKEVYTDFIF